MFASWSTSLYEARWGAVLEFLRKISPLLPTLASTFDAKKFKAGVDSEGYCSRARRHTLFHSLVGHPGRCSSPLRVETVDSDLGLDQHEKCLLTSGRSGGPEGWSGFLGRASRPSLSEFRSCLLRGRTATPSSVQSLSPCRPIAGSPARSTAAARASQWLAGLRPRRYRSSFARQSILPLFEHVSIYRRSPCAIGRLRRAVPLPLSNSSDGV